MKWTMSTILAFAICMPSAGQAPPKAVPVMDTGELMNLFLQPLYEELKQSLARPPADRKEWAAIYQAAVRLAEADNLLFIRPSGRHTDDPAWAPASAEARQAAADIAAATFVALRNVRRDDFEPLRARLTRVADTCNACHDTLRVDAKTIRP
jgi:hypothetical protein